MMTRFMGADELRQVMLIASWEPHNLAQRLMIDPRVVSRWMSGSRSIPPSVAMWMREVDRWNRANYHPQGWHAIRRMTEGNSE